MKTSRKNQELWLKKPLFNDPPKRLTFGHHQPWLQNWSWDSSECSSALPGVLELPWCLNQIRFWEISRTETGQSEIPGRAAPGFDQHLMGLCVRLCTCNYFTKVIYKIWGLQSPDRTITFFLLPKGVWGWGRIIKGIDPSRFRTGFWYCNIIVTHQVP